MKLRHRVGTHITRYASAYKTVGSLAISSAFLVGVFFITRGVAPTSELSFVEHSMLGERAGSVVPASCESGSYHIDYGSFPYYYGSDVGWDTAAQSVNSPSPQYYADGWYCRIWLLNYAQWPSASIGAGTDAQAWAQCKALYDSYSGYNRQMEYFGPSYDANGTTPVSCYTPPPPPPPSVDIQIQ